MATKIAHWAPRVLSVLFVILLSLFALDVLGEYQGFAVAPALFMHLLIPIVVALAAAAAWKWNLFGAAAFFAFALYYIWMVGPGRDWSWYATIAGPAAVIGALFLLDWFLARNRTRA
ncbi:MAG: hypothetical protein P4L67_03340 [Candidatus Pacebacteria bacterium]|nr:hypothetical protein [Candidatus Paceibacterota bacterium]